VRLEGATAPEPADSGQAAVSGGLTDGLFAHRRLGARGDSTGAAVSGAYQECRAALATANRYPTGTSPEGVYNLVGNVEEWTASPIQQYANYDQGQVWDGLSATLPSGARLMLYVRGQNRAFTSADVVRFLKHLRRQIGGQVAHRLGWSADPLW
jgi:formylglycine-generating enzyme required for sulfatase activity